MRADAAARRAARPGADPRRRAPAPVAARSRRRPRRSSSPPSPGRGSSCASSPRPPGSTRRARRRAVERGDPERAASRSCPSRRPPCRFTHELVRRAVYDRIAGIRRAELHLRVGEALERVHARRPDARPARARPPLHARRPGRRRRARASTTTCAPPTRRSRRRPSTRRRRGSRPRSSSGSPTRASARASRSSSATSSTRPGRLVGGRRDAGREPRRRDRPGGARHRGARARARMRRAPDGRSGARSATRCGRSPRRRSRRSTQLGDSRGLAVRPAVPRHGARGDRAAWPRLRGARTRARRTQRPPATRRTRRTVIGTLCHSLCRGPTPVGEAIRRCEELLRRSRDDRVLEAVDRRASCRCSSRWRAASTRRASSSERSSLVLDELDHDHVLGVPLGCRRGAESSPATTPAPSGSSRRQWQWFREVGRPAIDERAMHAAYRSRSSTATTAAGTTPSDCLAYGRDVPRARHSIRGRLRLAAEARLAAHRGDARRKRLRSPRARVELAEPSD